MPNDRRNLDISETDVLIVGAGAAGLRAAIELSRKGVETLVLGKRSHGDAHTVWAAGGINAALGNLDPDDRWDIHAADTIREGHFICDPRAVEILTKDAPERILELHEWGCPFSLTDEGKLNQRYFGAQSFRRTCFAGDRTGRAILGTLVSKAGEEGVSYLEDVYVSRLLKAEGRVCGAAGYDVRRGGYLIFRARAVVLAAGGFTTIYRRNSSREDENTADAVALGYEAGAALRDMEFVQFHPTGMIKPEEMNGKLVTEAVRGEGGRLFNAEGERFMQKYSPEHMELDARDVVARAIYREIQLGRGTEDGAVLLDISHRPPEYVKERLPRMYEQFMEQGVDMTREPMEVSPTAHYAMGGLRVDFERCETTVPGLYAVGEATAGVHGANRLGGNSLVETLVFGKVAGEHLAENAGDLPTARPDEARVEEHFARLDELATGSGTHKPEVLVTELRHLAWDHGGIVRTEETLREGLKKLEDLRERASSLEVRGGKTGRSFENALNLRNMLLATEAVLRGALLRAESRGAHHREDAPQARDEWQKNILYTRGEDRAMKLRTEPVGRIPTRVQEALEEDHGLDYHLLE